MENSDTSQKPELQRTLGQRLLLFGQQKISSVMKVISRLFHENSVAQRVTTFKKGSFRFSRELLRKGRVSFPMLQWRLSGGETVTPGAATKKRFQPDHETEKQVTGRSPLFSIPNDINRLSFPQEERVGHPSFSERFRTSRNDKLTGAYVAVSATAPASAATKREYDHGSHRKGRMSFPMLQWWVHNERTMTPDVATKNRFRPEHEMEKQETGRSPMFPRPNDTNRLLFPEAKRAGNLLTPSFSLKLRGMKEGFRTGRNDSSTRTRVAVHAMAPASAASRREYGPREYAQEPERVIAPNTDREVDRFGYHDHVSHADDAGAVKGTRAPEQAAVLPKPALEFFSRLLRMRLPSVIIHQGSASDKYLKRHRADAMTIGQHIHVRRGALDGARERGLGLLGHELTHVAQYHAGGDAAGASRGLNEKAALETERFILANPSVPGMRSTFSSSDSITAVSHRIPQAAAPAGRPLFAESSREVNGPVSPMPGPIAATLSDADMKRIKDEVYRDLMMRIKIDFERGA
jgi:Domain of unknown function (DUF4157)